MNPDERMQTETNSIVKKGTGGRQGGKKPEKLFKHTSTQGTGGSGDVWCGGKRGVKKKGEIRAGYHGNGVGGKKGAAGSGP